MSWVDWLKFQIKRDSKKDNEKVNSRNNNSTDNLSFLSPSTSDQNVSQLYPEEGTGITDFSFTKEGISNPSDSYIERPYGGSSLHTELSSFKRGLPIICSTPSVSSSPARKRANEEFLNEPNIEKPSTSEFQGENLSRRSDAYIYKMFSDTPETVCPSNGSASKFPGRKTFRDASEDPSESFSQSNGSVSALASGRKRRVYEISEDEVSVDEKYVNKLEKSSFSLSKTFTEQTENLSQTQQRKRPRFSVSSYGSPLYGKRLEDDEPSFSIFYPGKIMYGGASNHSEKRRRIIPRKVRPRPPASASGEGDASDGGLSWAARRILSCIDRISTPLSDSKRAFASVAAHSRRATDAPFESTFVADFHKHRPTFTTITKATPPPPANKLLTPAKARLHPLTPPSKPKEAKRPSPPLSCPPPPPPPAASERVATTRQDETPSPLKDASAKAPSSEIVSRPPPENTPSPPRPPETSPSVVVSRSSPSPKSGTSPAALFTFSEPEVVSLPCGAIEGGSLPPLEAAFQFSVPPSATDDFGGAWGSAYVPPKGSWECSVCLLQNTETRFTCAACESAKPASSSAAPVGGWGEKFAPPKGGWECDTCLIMNDAAAAVCVACSSIKPASTTVAATPAPPPPATSGGFGGWGEAFKPPAGGWECDSCLLQNEAKDSRCVACETVKPAPPGTNMPSAAPLRAGVDAKPPPPQWGEAFKPPKGSWECETCLVRNGGDASRCLSCQTPAPRGGGGPALVAQAVTGNFKFGLKTSAASSSVPPSAAYSFGSAPAVATSQAGRPAKVDESKAEASKPDATTFSFGKDPPGAGSEKVAPTFVFGQTSSKVEPSSVFNFGEQEKKADAALKPSPSLITFGNAASKITPTFTSGDAPKATMTFTFGGATPKTTQTITGDAAPKATSTFTAGDSSPKATPTFTFGGAASKATPTFTSGDAAPKAASTFATDDATPKATPTFVTTDAAPKATATFNFGDTTTKAASIFSFGNSPPNSSPSFTSGVGPPKATPTFTFGEAAPKSTPTSSFGNSASKSMPAFTSGDATTKGTPTIPFGNIDTKSTTFSFGNATPKTTSSFTFGNTALKATPTFTSSDAVSKATPTFTFGDPMPKPKPTFTFGDSVPKPTPTFNSGDAVPKATPTFTFGDSANKTPAFSFGETKNKAFNLNNNAAPAFSLGESNAKTSAFTFGNVNNKAAAFNVGTANAKPAVAFNFGADAAGRGGAPSFSFGKPSTSLFQFSQNNNNNSSSSNNVASPAAPFKSATEPAAPAFLNIEIPQTNPFSASGAPPGPKRVIKKALRRNK